MEEERVNLFVTKVQLDLITEGVRVQRDWWQDTLKFLQNGEGRADTVEECASACEAEFMVDSYSELKRELENKLSEVGVNELEVIASEYVGRANQTLEITKLTRGNHERVVYVYNFRGLAYYFFPSLLELVEFFDEGKDPERIFSSDRELDMFLRHYPARG